MNEDFYETVKKHVANAKSKHRDFAFLFMQEMSIQLIYDTPVDTGFLRGSWFYSKELEGTNQREVTDKSGHSTLGAIVLDLKNFNLAGDNFIINNAAYARFVNDGTSRMRGRRMIEKAINKAPFIANKVAQRIAADG